MMDMSGGCQASIIRHTAKKFFRRLLRCNATVRLFNLLGEMGFSFVLFNITRTVYCSREKDVDRYSVEQ